MAVSSTPYSIFLIDLGTAVHDFANDTDKVALLSNDYEPSFDSHIAFSDVNSFEVAGDGYDAGGIELPDKTWTYDDDENEARLNAGAITWTDLAVTTRYAVIYKDTGDPAGSSLIALYDFGEERTYSTEPFQLSFPSGVITVAALVSILD